MGQHNRYQSDILLKIADELQIRTTLDTLSEGSYIAQKKYKGKPLSILVNNGEIEHIGYTIFSAEIRKIAASPVFNFLERYALEASLPLKRRNTVERQLYEDDIRFIVGDITDLPTFFGKNNVEFSLENFQYRMCKAVWSQNGQILCSIAFPVNYNLFHGTDLEESQKRLVEDLLQASIDTTAEEKQVSPQELKKMSESDFYLLKGDSMYLASLNNNTYYIEEENNNFHLLFSEEHPIKSFANLLITNSITNNIQAKIKLVMYNFKSKVVQIPLVNMLNYFKEKGCKPYFGIIQSDNQHHTAELLLVNREEGYCHSMRLTFNTSNISSRCGTISGRMNSYVPISKIKSLFNEKQN